MHSLFLSNVKANESPPGSPTGSLWRELLVYKVFFYISLKFFIKISANKEIFHSLRGCRKGASLHVHQKRGPYGNRCTFPEPYLAYPSGSVVKEPSFQVPLIELFGREMPHPYSPPSLIFQSPRYRSPLPEGSPVGPFWREMPVSVMLLGETQAQLNGGNDNAAC